MSLTVNIQRDLIHGKDTADVLIIVVVLVIYGDTSFDTVVVLSSFVLIPKQVVVVFEICLGRPCCGGLTAINIRSSRR